MNMQGCTFASQQSPLLMSALGQKQTYAVQQTMSALPPIATAKADYRERSCPVYPRKRTSRLTATRSLPLHRLEVAALQRFLGGLERLLVVSAVRYCPDAVRTSRALTQ